VNHLREPFLTLHDSRFHLSLFSDVLQGFDGTDELPCGIPKGSGRDEQPLAVFSIFGKKASAS